MTTASIIPYRKPQNDAWDRLVEGLDGNGRIELLQRLLGEPACRRLGLYPVPEGFKLSVVIPVYNEERWLREVVRRVREVPIPKEIILVDAKELVEGQDRRDRRFTDAHDPDLLGFDHGDRREPVSNEARQRYQEVKRAYKARMKAQQSG